jgi:hypothetical protein
LAERQPSKSPAVERCALNWGRRANRLILSQSGALAGSGLVSLWRQPASENHRYSA